MRDGIYLSKEKYIHDLLSHVALTDQHTIDTSMELGVHLQSIDDALLDDPTRYCIVTLLGYCHLVGSLVYLGITRPDISHDVNILSQLVFAPTQLHYAHLLRVLQYLHGTISCRLFFPRSSSLQLRHTLMRQ